MNNFKAIDQETIKELNQKKIIQMLYRKNQLTKQVIAQNLKISIPTVISNVRELIERGFLDEIGVAESSGGRKPVIVRFLPDARYSFGVLITKEQVRIILTNLKFDIMAEKIFDITDEVNKFNDIIAEVRKEIDNIISANNIPRDKILGVGFSLPGTVNEEKLLLKNAPNLKLKDICFKEFEQDFQIPIFIENEANAAAYAEAFINFNYIKNSLVFISITEGIGTGIIISDNVYRGYNKRAGEFGHMTIVKDGKQCNCGRKGCWELYASRKALIDEYRKTFNIKDKTLKDFLEMTKIDSRAKEILNNYLEFLAEGIRNIILILDPQCIIIEGELSNYKNLIEDDLKNKIFQENNFYDEKECKVLFSNLEGNASIFGAAFLPMKKLFFLDEKVI
ncbi:Sugar kinase of the NBD/HSP70 family, may contain an N-terminal HTH domain [Clostridium acidisoli DSM 12555]|uniref:Sugar kinase of the NBD/HSP70 family, may contain an N-terminal HTH domain n=1 Tax=Clostridium acidisoli DSM 12555 TaxID=1121291 RepID=A0A1W1XJ51_9CLOT|nr:ROK family transcriptional regulator [Clostridium acidisoli]SMC23852.1 Sugar kinase of the NBD/HSP70 family, may contain an N-terminal HTH domain [Clostridium acidisoli DSM 12555]